MNLLIKQLYGHPKHLAGLSWWPSVATLGGKGRGLNQSWGASCASPTRACPSQVLMNHDLIFIIGIRGLQPSCYFFAGPRGPSEWGARELLWRELSGALRKPHIDSKPHLSIQCFKTAAELDVGLEWNGFCFPSEGSTAQSGEVRSRNSRHGKVSTTLLLRPQTRITGFLWARRPLLLSLIFLSSSQASQVALVVKNLPASAGDVRDVGSIPGSGRSPGREYGNPLQNSCLENPQGQRKMAGYSP